MIRVHGRYACRLVGALIAILFFQLAYAVAKSPAPISLNIATDVNPVRVGEEVKITAMVRNETQEPIVIADGQTDGIYKVEMRDSLGSPVPERNRYRFYSIGGMKLDPGQSHKDEIVLSHMYDLSRPGRYFVVVGRNSRIEPESGTEGVRSNVLVINVTQAEASDAAAALDPSEVIVPEIKGEGTQLENFMRLLNTVRLSGGIVTLHDDCSQGPKTPLSITARTKLESALTDAITFGSQSRWQIQEGVVNGLPLSGPPALLNIRIVNFEWNRSASPKTVLAELHDLPEFSEAIRDLALKEGPFEGGPGVMCIRGGCPQQHTTPTLQVEKDITLLDLLNRIVGGHRGTIWNYSEYSCSGEKQFRLGIVAE
jgi:hypothetical protein